MLLQSPAEEQPVLQPSRPPGSAAFGGCTEKPTVEQPWPIPSSQPRETSTHPAPDSPWRAPLSALLRWVKHNTLHSSSGVPPGVHHVLWRSVHPASNPSMASNFWLCDCEHVPVSELLVTGCVI